MAQTFDRKILRALQDNGVREIRRTYEVVSKRLTIFQTDRGTFKYSDSLYRLVAPRQFWEELHDWFYFRRKIPFLQKIKYLSLKE